MVLVTVESTVPAAILSAVSATDTECGIAASVPRRFSLLKALCLMSYTFTLVCCGLGLFHDMLKGLTCLKDSEMKVEVNYSPSLFIAG